MPGRAGSPAAQQPELLLLADVRQVPHQRAHQRVVLREQGRLVEVGEQRGARPRQFQIARDHLTHGRPPRTRPAGRPRRCGRRAGRRDTGRCRRVRPGRATAVASSPARDRPRWPGSGAPPGRAADRASPSRAASVHSPRDRLASPRRPGRRRPGRPAGSSVTAATAGHHRGARHVQVADLEVAARPHRREERRQVVAEVGERRAAVREPDPPRHQSPNGTVRATWPRSPPSAATLNMHRRAPARSAHSAARVAGRQRRRWCAGPVPPTPVGARDFQPGVVAGQPGRARRDRRAASGPSCCASANRSAQRRARSGLQVHLQRRGGASSSCAPGVAAPSRDEVLLHRAVPRPRVDPARRSQRVGAEVGQARGRVRRGPAARAGVVAHRGDRGRDAVGSAARTARSARPVRR